MGDGTGIEWTDATWNPMRGCRRVSEGCRHCYAETMASRFCDEGQPYEGLAHRTDDGGRWTGQGMLVQEKLEQPLRWTKPRKVFVNSMSDVFFEAFSNEQIAQVFAVMALCQILGLQHQFQVLTKRASRMVQWFQWLEAQRASRKSILAFLPDAIKYGTYGKLLLFMASKVHGAGNTLESYAAPWPLYNVWMGVSVEDQSTADARIPLLLQVPAAVRWLSMEPLLGPVDLGRWLAECRQAQREDAPIGADVDGMRRVLTNVRDRWERVDWIHWIVVGGESGSKARPMHPAWARMVRDQCVETKTPFLFKQWGRWRALGEGDDRSEKAQWVEFDGSESTLHDPEAEWAVLMDPVGKKKAGRELDGRTWDQYPEVS